MSCQEDNHGELGTDATLAAALFAVSPGELGGIVVRSGAGPWRDRFCALVKALLPPEAPLLRVPVHVTEDRLLGGLSLAATLRSGRLVAERGLLARAHGGVVVVSMAERIHPQVTSQLCSAIDRREVTTERDGLTGVLPCRLGVVALDEGIDDERVPAALGDRMAFHVDLSTADPRAEGPIHSDAARVVRARELLKGMPVDDDILTALSEAASALGIRSLRAPLLAVQAALAHAALQGNSRVLEGDAAVAARLVLGPRATRMPAVEAVEEEGDAAEKEESEPATADDRTMADGRDRSDSSDDEATASRHQELAEVLLDAAKSAIPVGLLDALSVRQEPRAKRQSEGRSGAARGSTQAGRPAGTRPGSPLSGERLNIVETLRAAAPWQRIRRNGALGNRVEVRKEDFRITHFRRRAETSVTFSVDASGSAAMQRLAEAKGAVEQLLADCYVRRDHVALVAFRGTTATVLLPPTRSLARVRRGLADLAGGGSTPLAAGIDAALVLALEARKRGRTPVIVLMTDGRANVARDGTRGVDGAAADALGSARAVRAAGVRVLFLDTSPRPRAQARLLSTELGAQYLPLPYVDASRVSRHVRSLAAGAT